MTIVDYHKTRSVLDMKFIESVFVQDERELLAETCLKNPHSAVRMPTWDAMTLGYKGRVPASDEWNGEVIQL